jgi:Calx-beta domain
MTHRSSSPTRLLAAASLVAVLMVAPEVASPAAACANQHSDMWLTGFQTGDAAPRFYMTAEDHSPVAFIVQTQIHSCVNVTDNSVRVSWQATPGTALAGSDYMESGGISPNLNSPACPFPDDCFPTYQDSVPIIDDPDTEDVTEHFQLTISTASGRVLPPSVGRVYIVDDDGAPRVAFGEPLEPYQQFEFNTAARIPVFRAGDVSGLTTTVNYSLVPQTAEANDFSPASGTVSFAPGERLRFIQFTINNDDLPEDNETIQATLSGVSVDNQSLTQVSFTILDEDSDNGVPSVRFHHPRQGLRYKQGDFRLREMHTIAGDSQSGVASVEMALRQRRMNGTCRWWNGDRFADGGCGSRRWLSMRLIGPWTASTDVYGRRFPALTPSVGTNIRNYTAWTRAEDGAGNVEDSFERGRNLSTFEVLQS